MRTALIISLLIFLLTACGPVTVVPAETLTSLPAPLATSTPKILSPTQTQTPCSQPTSWTIEFQRTGGIAGWSQQVVVASNGEIKATDLRKNQSFISTVSSQEISRLSEALVMGCPFVAPRPNTNCADCFEYTFMIEMDGKQYRAKATDVSIPESLRPLLQEMTSLMQKALSK